MVLGAWAGEVGGWGGDGARRTEGKMNRGRCKREENAVREGPGEGRANTMVCKGLFDAGGEKSEKQEASEGESEGGRGKGPIKMMDLTWPILAAAAAALPAANPFGRSSTILWPIGWEGGSLKFPPATVMPKSAGEMVLLLGSATRERRLAWASPMPAPAAAAGLDWRMGCMS